MTLAPPEDQDILLVGGSGNLARKKLLPALYNLAHDGLLPHKGNFVILSRDELDDASFRKLAASAIKKYSRRKFEPDLWDSITRRFRFANVERGLESVRESVTLPLRTTYLAIPPSAFGPVTRQLLSASLVEGSKLVVEKPFGTDLESSRALEKDLRKIFDEQDVFRIDHYMGKETVQNILALRFGNFIFERIWNRDSVEHVQITIAEDIGIEERGQFYEGVGALRDIIQNHALQVISLLAMEPPISFEPERVRDERVKLLRAVAPLMPSDVVRGQYTTGELNAQAVPGYREEPGVAGDSQTDTFIAARFRIDNWRWAGVPFYVRAGKRLPRRITEVQIAFKSVPMTCFRSAGIEELPGNHLTIRIQPSESISVSFAAKTPGPDMQVEPVQMNFRYDTTFSSEPQEAYERLLYDAMVGDQTLFLRSDAVDRAWEIVQPVIDDMPPSSTTQREHGDQNDRTTYWKDGHGTSISQDVYAASQHIWECMQRMTNIVFLVDVDNTLLDNDSVIGLLEKNVASAIGPVRMRQFFDLYEEVRAEMDFVNFPETLERFSRRCDDAGCVGALSHALYTFPFSELVYPGSFDALEHINKLGTSVVLTDGDQLFQRYKVRSTGIEATVDGRVLIYVHKENETDDIQKKFPADHDVIIDDKPRIHAAVKSKLGSRITTIMVRQGKYALEPDREYLPGPDIVLESIADLVSLSKQRILTAA